MDKEQLQDLWNSISDMVYQYGLKIVGAIAVLVVGRIIVKAIVKKFTKTLQKREVDPTIIPTIRGVVNVALMAALIFAVIGIVGIPTSGFIAVFGAAGLAIGLALQGSLSNFAGGILILTLKPFKAGDFVEVNGESGTVHSVTIINTILKTPDNKTIYLANGSVAGANITNFTLEPKRRWDKVFGIGYEDDFDKAKKIIMDFLEADERVHKDPAPFVRVGNLGDSSVDITVRAWVDTAEYWNLNWDMIEKVKKEFDKQGISIPFPQRDVHVYNH
ncbi:mechanosensitive ion channel family protein [Roseivirga sp.]|uniref:mechanosensitive ion channel family protein n=1 Tax=Roseivirga sp. TaxID=1964215 RepID=UPI003B51C5B2